MASGGQLSGERIGGIWLLDESSVERRKRLSPQAGRPFESRNAWGILLLASGQEPEGLDSSSLSRLKRILRENGVEQLIPRLAKRGKKKRYRSHPGELKYIIEDERLTATGISAAGYFDLDLVSGAEVDGYVRESEEAGFISRHALKPASDGNVSLRVVPDESWEFVREGRKAPPAAVAVDLLEDVDARSQSAGRQALESLVVHLPSNSNPRSSM